MTFKCFGEDLCPLDPEIDSTVLDGRQGCLGNAGQFSQLALAQLLKLADDANRLAYRDFNPFFGSTKLLHFKVSCNREA